MIEFTIKTLESINHHFAVEDETTVAQLKEQIRDEMGIEINMQRLIFCGRVLTDERRLSEFDLNGKVIHLVPRPPPRSRYRSVSPTPRQEMREAMDEAQRVINRMASQSNRPGLMRHIWSIDPPSELVLDQHQAMLMTPTSNRLEFIRRTLDDIRNSLSALFTHMANGNSGDVARSSAEPMETETSPLTETLSTETPPTEKVPTNRASSEKPVSEKSSTENTQTETASTEKLPMETALAEKSPTETGSTEKLPKENLTTEKPKNETPPTETPPTRPEVDDMDDEFPYLTGGRAIAPRRRRPLRTSRPNLNRPRDLAQLVDELDQLHEDFAPFRSNYLNILRDSSPALANSERVHRQNIIELVCDVMHSFAHAYHAVSDISVEIGERYPRLATGFTISRNQSPVQAHINLVRTSRHPNDAYNQSRAGGVNTSSRRQPGSGSSGLTPLVAAYRAQRAAAAAGNAAAGNAAAGNAAAGNAAAGNTAARNSAARNSAASNSAAAPSAGASAADDSDEHENPFRSTSGTNTTHPDHNYPDSVTYQVEIETRLPIAVPIDTAFLNDLAAVAMNFTMGQNQRGRQDQANQQGLRQEQSQGQAQGQGDAQAENLSQAQPQGPNQEQVQTSRERGLLDIENLLRALSQAHPGIEVVMTMEEVYPLANPISNPVVNPPATVPTAPPSSGNAPTPLTFGAPVATVTMETFPRPSTGFITGTNTGTNAAAGTNARTGTGTNAGTGNNAGIGTGTNAGTGIGTNATTGIGTNARTGTGTNAGSGTGNNPSTGTGAKAKTVTGAKAGTGTGTKSGTGTGLNSGTGNGPYSGTGAGPNQRIDAGPGPFGLGSGVNIGTASGRQCHGTWINCGPGQWVFQGPTTGPTGPGYWANGSNAGPNTDPGYITIYGPGTIPTIGPGTGPGAGPGTFTVPGAATGPASGPATGPATGPVSGLASDPGTGLGTNPGTGLGTNPGTGFSSGPQPLNVPPFWPGYGSGSASSTGTGHDTNPSTGFGSGPQPSTVPPFWPGHGPGPAPGTNTGARSSPSAIPIDINHFWYGHLPSPGFCPGNGPRSGPQSSNVPAFWPGHGPGSAYGPGTRFGPVPQFVNGSPIWSGHGTGELPFPPTITTVRVDRPVYGGPYFSSHPVIPGYDNTFESAYGHGHDGAPTFTPGAGVTASGSTNMNLQPDGGGPRDPNRTGSMGGEIPQSTFPAALRRPRNTATPNTGTNTAPTNTTATTAAPTNTSTTYVQNPAFSASSFSPVSMPSFTPAPNNTANNWWNNINSTNVSGRTSDGSWGIGSGAAYPNVLHLENISMSPEPGQERLGPLSAMARARTLQQAEQRRRATEHLNNPHIYDPALRGRQSVNNARAHSLALASMVYDRFLSCDSVHARTRVNERRAAYQELHNEQLRQRGTRPTAPDIDRLEERNFHFTTRHMAIMMRLLSGPVTREGRLNAFMVTVARVLYLEPNGRPRTYDPLCMPREFLFVRMQMRDYVQRVLGMTITNCAHRSTIHGFADIVVSQNQDFLDHMSEYTTMDHLGDPIHTLRFWLHNRLPAIIACVMSECSTDVFVARFYTIFMSFFTDLCALFFQFCINGFDGFRALYMAFIERATANFEPTSREWVRLLSRENLMAIQTTLDPQSPSEFYAYTPYDGFPRRRGCCLYEAGLRPESQRQRPPRRRQLPHICQYHQRRLMPVATPPLLPPRNDTPDTLESLPSMSIPTMSSSEDSESLQLPEREFNEAEDSDIPPSPLPEDLEGSGADTVSTTSHNTNRRSPVQTRSAATSPRHDTPPVTAQQNAQNGQAGASPARATHQSVSAPSSPNSLSEFVPPVMILEHWGEEWVPVFTRDQRTQREQERPQEPYSDAYLSGMPSRKRRCVRASRPPTTLDGFINESTREATDQAASLDPVHVRDAFCETVRSIVRVRAQNSEDYDPLRYSSTARFLDDTKQDKNELEPKSDN